MGVRRRGRTVRSSTRAPIRIIPKSMHMHPTLGIRVVTRNVPCNRRLGRLIRLLEGYGAFDVGVTSEDGNCTHRQISLAPIAPLSTSNSSPLPAPGLV